jgi:ACT domain-containing protein
MKFITHTIDETDTTLATISVKDYVPTQLSDLLDTIQTIRENSVAMVISFDMRGAGIISLEQFQSISKLVFDVIDYTKDDNLLQKVEIIGAGFFFKLLYRPVSIAIPRQIRDMIVFV